MLHGKMSDFVSFLLFGFTVVVKLGNFDLKVPENTLIFLDNKNGVRFYHVLSNSV